MNYSVIITDTAESLIRQNILYVEKNFGAEIALKKLDELGEKIMNPGSDPYIGTEPRYPLLKRQGYKVLILDKNLVFYRIQEQNKTVIIYAVVDQRQDYIDILRGL